MLYQFHYIALILACVFPVILFILRVYARMVVYRLKQSSRGIRQSLSRLNQLQSIADRSPLFESLIVPSMDRV